MWLPMRSSCRLGPGTGGCFAVSLHVLCSLRPRPLGSRSLACLPIEALTFELFSVWSILRKRSECFSLFGIAELSRQDDDLVVHR